MMSGKWIEKKMIQFKNIPHYSLCFVAMAELYSKDFEIQNFKSIQDKLICQGANEFH